MTTNLPEKPERWTELDGVRGLATLLVVYMHTLLMWVPGSPSPVFWLRSASGLAWTGVHLFFVLSGFLIGGILLAHRDAANYFRVFYARRCLRILPLYFSVVLAFFAIRAFSPLGQDAKFDFGAVPAWSYFLFVQNFPMAMTQQWGPAPLGVTWSVALEEQFYLFLPLWIHVVPRRWLEFSFALLIACGPVFRGLIPAVDPGFLLPGAFESLAGGTWLAWAFRNRPTLFQSSRGRWLAAALAAGGACGMALALTRHDLGAFKETAIACFWGGFFWLVLSALRTVWTAPLRSRFLVWVGGISYGVYLFHSFVNAAIYPLLTGGPARKALGAQGLAIACLSIALTLLLAWASHRLFESPLIRLGRRLHYREPAPHPVTSEKAGVPLLPSVAPAKSFTN